MCESSKFTYVRELVVGMKNVNCQFIVLDVESLKRNAFRWVSVGQKPQHNCKVIAAFVDKAVLNHLKKTKTFGKTNVHTVRFLLIREVSPRISLEYLLAVQAPPRKTKDGHDVRNVRVADRSGSVWISVWDEVGTCLQPSDICRLFNGYVSVHKNCLMLNVGRLGEIQKIGEFCMLFSEAPYMSAPNSEFTKVSDQQKSFPTQQCNGDNNTVSDVTSSDILHTAGKGRSTARN